MEDGTYIYPGPRIIDGDYVDGVGRSLMRIEVVDGEMYDWDTGLALEPTTQFHISINHRLVKPFPLRRT